MALIGHWVASDANGTGTTLPDRSASLAHGTLTAGCTWVTVNGQAAVRCPAADGVSIPDHARWTFGSNFTLVARLVFNAFSGQPAWIGQSAGGLKWAWYHDGSQVLMHWQSSGAVVYGGSFAPAVGTSHSLAVKRAVGAFTFYRNGAISGTNTQASAFSDVVAPLYLGWGGETFWNSDVSLVAIQIYDTALSDAEVYAAMLAMEPPVVALKLKVSGSWVKVGGSAVLVPPGGTTGQLLTKASATDYATAWSTPPAAGAPTAGSYVTLAAEAALSAERRLVVTAPVTLTDGGAGTTVTLALADDGVTDLKLRNSAALSVIGRNLNAAGDPADIVAASDGQVLRRSGTLLAFGALNLASANAVTGAVPAANGGVPAGGATNAILAKTSATDYATGWTTAPILTGLTVNGLITLAYGQDLGSLDAGSVRKPMLSMGGGSDQIYLGYHIASTIQLGGAGGAKTLVQGDCEITGTLTSKHAVRAAGYVDPTGPSFYANFGVTAVSKIATGQFRITLVAAVALPVVVATPAVNGYVCATSGLNATQFDVYTLTLAGTAADTYFTFAVMAP